MLTRAVEALEPFTLSSHHYLCLAFRFVGSPAPALRLLCLSTFLFCVHYRLIAMKLGQEDGEGLEGWPLAFYQLKGLAEAVIKRLDQVCSSKADA